MTKIYRFFGFFCLIITFLVQTKVIFAQELRENIPQVLIINQVRGKECCEIGSIEFLKKQVEKLDSLDLSAFFTIRYDALNEVEFVNYLQNRRNLGLFLEITPSLARDAKVEYKADANNWYEAQHAYTIGYSPEERIKLIDQLFSTFKEKFAYYPEITTGWILDTPSLNYIHKKYGVKIHQITREQWGTDSYTLYGGVPHYPYPASQNWLFMPDFQRNDATFIVRQTISDPVYNYGDMSSSFTSQPNDYMKSNKNIDYFKRLINQALFEQPYSQVGFALIGIENSMQEKYQEEYLKQLDYVHDLKTNQSKQAINIVSDLDEIINIYKDINLNIYYGKDILNDTNLGNKNTQNQAYFISTPNYRVRLKIDKNQVYISDYRIFSANIEDPYTRLKANNLAFWVTPFIIDGSRWPQDRNFLETFYLKYPWWHQYGLQTHSDQDKKVTRIDLPNKKIDEPIQFINNNLTYLDENGHKITLSFREDSLSISPILIKQLKYRSYTPKSFPLDYTREENSLFFEWGRGENRQYGLKIDCFKDKTCIFKPEINIFDTQSINNQPYFFPENKVLEEVRVENIDFFAHNSYAVAGRNPIRLILIVKNENNFPSIITKQINIEAENNSKNLNIDELQQLQSGIYFVDIRSQTPQKAKLFLNIESTSNNASTTKRLSKALVVHFAPDCKIDIKYCLKHPKQAYYYLQTIIRDKF